MTATGTQNEAQRIRAGLKHPVVDGDGHLLESLPLLMQYLEKLYGADAVAAFDREYSDHPQRTMGDAARGEPRSGWWANTNNALDQATCTAPGLMYERLPELGIDFAICYPSIGIRLSTTYDPQVRKQTARALNVMFAELCAPYADRITPVAAIPMGTPEEAVEELNYVVTQLGSKVAVFPAATARPLAAFPGAFPAAQQPDRYGLDSAYDYSPVWQACVDLGIAVTFHGGSGMLYMRDAQDSPTNFAANHIGAHAYLQQQVMKSLIMGGVMRRFPALKFAFLEGGAGWATEFVHHLEEHWEKRSGEGLESLDPRLMDRALFAELLQKYGIPVPGQISGGSTWRPGDVRVPGKQLDDEMPWIRDEFEESLITDEDQIKDIFENQLFFGCESDDTSVYRAQDTKANAMHARLRPIFSSDMGHFDIADIRTAVPASYELVEDGLLNDDDYREFMFENAVLLHGGMNPKFFDGTAVEKEAKALLQRNAAGS